jgi:signal transduction histidine kinase
VALELIQQTFDQSTGNAWPHWQKGLAELLQQDHQPPDWLRSIAAATAIAVDGAGFQGSILLLGAAGIGVDPTLRANLASLGAIAFQQHQLQGQAQRNAEQLRHLNALKEDFLSTLNHELRTPLTSMMLAIRMLRRPDLTPDRAALYLDILEQQCSREIGLVNDLLMLQTLESKAAPAVRQTTDLGPLLGNIAEQSTTAFQQAQLSLDWQPPAQAVELSTDPDLWTKVLRELLGNARKYSAPQTAVTLALADHRAQNGRVTLQISNLGAAIEADELPHIFDTFRRGRHATSDGIAGTGTGLALVRGLVAQLGGTIRVSSHPSDADPSPSDATLWQTCFTLEFS